MLRVLSFFSLAICGLLTGVSGSSLDTDRMDEITGGGACWVTAKINCEGDDGGCNALECVEELGDWKCPAPLLVDCPGNNNFGRRVKQEPYDGVKPAAIGQAGSPAIRIKPDSQPYPCTEIEFCRKGVNSCEVTVNYVAVIDIPLSEHFPGCHGFPHKVSVPVCGWVCTSDGVIGQEENCEVDMRNIYEPLPGVPPCVEPLGECEGGGGPLYDDF